MSGDIVSDLRDAMIGLGLSDAYVQMGRNDALQSVLKRAIAEIENLRSLCGKAQVGPSFADISKAAVRSGVQTIKFEDAPQ